jgi:hypothetical protein
MAQLVPKNRTPCKKWWRDSQNPIRKKKTQLNASKSPARFHVHFIFKKDQIEILVAS